MFDQRIEIDADDAVAECELHALDNVLQPNSAPVSSPNRGFELPRRLWGMMFTCYALFFVMIGAATGGSTASRFAIVVSIIYTAIYFGVARIGAKQAGPEARSPLEEGKSLQTWAGPMDAVAVYGQVLIVPFAIALFGCAILIVTLLVR